MEKWGSDSGHDHVIVGKYGVLETQLGLLQVGEGLVENNGKANPTDTELLPNFSAGFLDPQLVVSFIPGQLT